MIFTAGISPRAGRDLIWSRPALQLFLLAVRFLRFLLQVIRQNAADCPANNEGLLYEIMRPASVRR
jgi:hypothetical protein